MGPTVCELDGPMPILNRSNKLVFMTIRMLAWPIKHMAAKPRIQTTTVGSYPIPDWLTALPSEQARLDATRVVFDIQRQAGIDLPTDGELYRFDVNHPDTNGMIEYFIPMAGVRAQVGRSDHEAFGRMNT